MKKIGALFALALAVRLCVMWWARSHFPATADGRFYDVLAQRIAHGDGYTWLWDDGTITYVAHYPVGYPALLAFFYRLFGTQPIVAGLVNAFFGAIAAPSTYALAGKNRRAIFAAIAVAIHPALVLYTPAIMTEGITTSLVVLAAAIACGDKRFEEARTGGVAGDRNPPPRTKRFWTRIVLAGVVLGCATLVRPQSLLFAPLLGLCAAPRARVVSAIVATACAIVVCLPWTFRNCEKMNRCALVSVNAGWNLLIGTQTQNGSWDEIDVPTECRTVWDEAGKDVCFERAARREILAHPIAWLKRAPAKLRTTFDYFGAGPWYLHASNPKRFGDGAKTMWGTIETIAERLLLVGALFAWVRRTRGDVLRVATLSGMLLALTDQCWIAYLVLPLAVLRARDRSPGETFSALAILVTAMVHAAFFGAGRYGLIVVPFVCVLTFARATRSRS